MITINEYIEWYKKEKQKMLDSGMYKSEPKFLFTTVEYEDEWSFNPDNWNGGDILRHGLIEIINNYRPGGIPEIRWFNHDGQTTILVFIENDWYEISWYKSRGRTDHIRMNGEPIYLSDYIDLCNLLNLPLK